MFEKVKSIKIFAILLLSLILILILGYQVRELTLINLSDEYSKKIGATFIKTKLGVLCYKYHGPPDGHLLIMMHGWSYPKEVFNQNIDDLTDSGFKVLTFDHFGRGCSDRPKVKHDANFYELEVLGLLKALKIEKPFYLLGYSMGGAVASIFTSRHPHKIKKLILVDPVGATPSIKGEQKLLLIPILGKFLMSYFGIKAIISGVEAEFNKGQLTNNMSFSFKEQFKYKGTVHSLTSSLKDFVSINQIQQYKEISIQKTPVMLIWGDGDKDVPFEGHQVLQKYIDGIAFHPIKNADHAALYTHSTLVNKLILDFIK